MNVARTVNPKIKAAARVLVAAAIRLVEQQRKETKTSVRRTSNG